MQPVEMRTGATVSGAMHLGFLALALFGMDFFGSRESAPLVVTEVELIDGVEFEARMSTAPVVPSEGPAELAPQASSDAEPIELSIPDVTINVPAMPILPEFEAPADEPPDLADLPVPPPPVVVPHEAPRSSIALIPSPDPLPRRAAEPESPSATEPLQPLAAAPTPEPAPRPAVPPESDPITVEPDTAEAPRPAIAPVPSPDPLPRRAAEPESPPATEPLQPLAAAPAPEPAPRPAPPPEPEPDEPLREPDPDVLVEADRDAPVADVPREARLPVARPAELAAADRASSAPEPVAAAPEPAEEPTEPAGGSTSQFANAVTVAEKDALQLGIWNHFYYPGNRADPGLQVTIEIRLGRDTRFTAKPKLLRDSGGTQAARDALFQAGRRALLKAQIAGEFKKLPPAKYDGWKLIHVTFTPQEIGFST